MKQKHFGFLAQFLLVSAVCAAYANAQSADISISEILSAVQKNADFLKENLVDLVSREEITVDEFGNKGETKKTTNIISEYRVFAEPLNNSSDCNGVSETLYFPQSRRPGGISREAFGILRETLGIPREKRETLSVKVDNKTPRTAKAIFNAPVWDEEHSFAGYLALFNKQYEQCFNYKFLGVETVNDRAAYAVEITRIESGGEQGDVSLNPVYKSMALIDAETMDIVQLNRGKININHEALADISNADPVAVLNRILITGKQSQLHFEVLKKKLQSRMNKGAKNDPLYAYLLEPFTVLDSWEYFLTRYEYGQVKIGDQFLTLPVAKTIEVFEVINNKKETIDRLAAVYKYNYSDYKSADQKEIPFMPDSGNIPALRAKILQGAQRQAELLKEYLVDIISSEELTVEYWDTDKNKISRTDSIISDYRTIPQGAAGIITALAQESPTARQPGTHAQKYPSDVLKQIFPNSNGTLETVPYCQALVFGEGRNNFLKENRVMLFAKENGRAVRSIKSSPFEGKQNSFAELLIFFDKQNEKCFDYELRGAAKVKDRNAIIMEIKLKNNPDKIMDIARIPAWAPYEYTDRVLFDAVTLEIIQYEKTMFMQGAVLPLTVYPCAQHEPPTGCIYPPGTFDYAVSTINGYPEDSYVSIYYRDLFRPSSLRSALFHSRIYFYQVEYGKIKIKDQLLTLPTAKTIDLFFHESKEGTLFHSTLSDITYDTFKARYITNPRPRLFGVFKPYVKPAVPDLFSFPAEVHSYKYSDYRLFDVTTKITFGEPEEMSIKEQPETNGR